ncbi:MAG TPA: hypothetical protein VIK30_04060 [Polyangia bacterium]
MVKKGVISTLIALVAARHHGHEWVTAGGSIRRRVRMFLAWLARAGVTARLDVAWNQYPATRAALSDHDRLDLLARLLYDDSLAALIGWPDARCCSTPSR